MSRPLVKVGCCGFPLARAKYYKQLPVIEVQQTFYQPPSIATVRRWREEAPGAFEFTIKAWQLITHEPSSPTYRRLKIKLSSKEASQVGFFRWSPTTKLAWESTLEVASELRADKILFQCPASFKPTHKNKERLSNFFNKIDRHGLILIWEPRGRWENREIEKLCRELHLVHCVDPFKSRPTTEGLFYFRLHGIGGYRHSYSDEELSLLRELIDQAKIAYVMFNNMTMFEDALRLRSMLSKPSANLKRK